VLVSAARNIAARRLSVLLLTTAAAVAVATPSRAAPANGEQFSVTCAGLGTFQVMSTPGNGPFTPVFPVGTHRVLIPYAVHGTVTVAGTSTVVVRGKP
jgi:hypothetical protein